MLRLFHVVFSHSSLMVLSNMEVRAFHSTTFKIPRKERRPSEGKQCLNVEIESLMYKQLSYNAHRMKKTIYSIKLNVLL